MPHGKCDEDITGNEQGAMQPIGATGGEHRDGDDDGHNIQDEFYGGKVEGHGTIHDPTRDD